MIGGSFVAGIGFLQITGTTQGPTDKSDLIALWIQTVMYSILGVVGAFGFIGTLIRNSKMVSIFGFVLALHLGFNVASGLFSIYAMFTQDTSMAVIQCAASASDSNLAVSLQDCQNGMTAMKGVMVAVYVLTWILQLYAYFIVERYADQLDEEEMASQTRVVPRSLPEISAPLNSMSSYTGHNSGYPFLASHQAYGSGRRGDQSNMV